MKKLPELILERSRALPEGGVLAPKEFLGVGSRAAIDQAFSRLAKAGKLLRICRGTYVVPVKSRFGTRAPSAEKIVQALAEKNNETVTSTGARAANALGLTQQVPVREMFLTSGRPRTLKLGKTEIQVKHAPRWMLGGPPPAKQFVLLPGWVRVTPTRQSSNCTTSCLPPNGPCCSRVALPCPHGWPRSLARRL